MQVSFPASYYATMGAENSVACATDANYTLPSHPGKRVFTNSLVTEENGIISTPNKRRKVETRTPLSRSTVVLRSGNAISPTSSKTHTVITPVITVRAPTDGPKSRHSADGSLRASSIHRDNVVTDAEAGLTGTIVLQKDRRSLRSHDGGSRSKSELAQYFSNWDDIISNKEREPELLEPETLLFITEEIASTSSTPTKLSVSAAHISPTKATTSIQAEAVENASPNAPNPTDFELVDFSADLAQLEDSTIDPLDDALFQRYHRRAERQEKQLKNIEKERAQHEKVQLERLFEGLQGPDWLRVMGISGITDSERKNFEGKRSYVMKEVKAMIDKFKWWKEEEKRLRLQKEMLHSREDEDEDDDGGTTRSRLSSRRPSRATSSIPVTDPAALQLQIENQSMSTRKLKRPRLYLRPPVPPTPPTTSGSAALTPAQLFSLPLQQPPAVELPFTSFFSKPHLREAAMEGRRRGRTVLAWGQPIPDPPERSFELPADMITDEARKAGARSRRRNRRSMKGA